MSLTLLQRATFGGLVLFCLLRGAPVRAQRSDDGTGALRGTAGGRSVELPLVEMRAELYVTGPLLHAIVTQRFENPYDASVDADYTFPLPDRAAVDAMELHVGARVIVAEVREKQAARAEFEQAKREGKRASLVEQQRPNLFSTRVANIAAGETVNVRLEYREELRATSGTYSLVFPMTYTSRYSRETADSSQCAIAGGDALSPAAEVVITIDAGTPLAAVASSSHALQVEHNARGAVVTLHGQRVPADRDLVLTWRSALESTAHASLLVEEVQGERFGLLTLFPPDPGSGAANGFPTETLFVVDVSGSMEGPSIEQAKAALSSALKRLRSGDRFNLLQFNDSNAAMSESSLLYGLNELDRAQAWVNALHAGGGTEIDGALLRAIGMLGASRFAGEQRIVLITDGAVDNETELMTRVQQVLGKVRLHVVGIGSAPNRWLMRKLAEFGRGACSFVVSIESVEASMNDFLQRIDRPVWSDISLRWKGTVPLESYPERVPDLYAGEPIMLLLKLDPDGEAPQVILEGRGPDGMAQLAPVVPQAVRTNAGLGTRWAREKIESLIDSLPRGGDFETVKRNVTALGLEFHLVTAYTSLVAVDKTPKGLQLNDADVSQDGGVLPQGGTLGTLLLYSGIVASAIGLLGLRVWNV